MNSSCLLLQKYSQAMNTPFFSLLINITEVNPSFHFLFKKKKKNHPYLQESPPAFYFIQNIEY